MKFKLITLIFITNISMGQDIDKKYSDLIKQIVEINNKEDYEIVSFKEEELKGLFKGQSRLFGMYEKDDLQKMTLISISELGVESFDYYFSNGQLIYINETFDQVTKKGELPTNRSFYGRYYFKNNKMYDSETKGHNRFEDDNLDAATILLGETRRNIKLLADKKINSHE
jgi:hypothetical protein